MISVAPRSRVAGWVVAVAAVAIALPLFGADFYEQQLRAGKEDRAAGKLVEATDELRIAAFGFLDRPLLLSEALANLALAQNALGQTEAATQTIDRFLDVERRFATYVPSETDAETRKAFEALLLAAHPRSELAAIPSLERITRSDAQKVADLPPSKRAEAFEEGAKRAPRDVEWPLAAATDAASRGLDDDAIRWARRALNIDRDNDAARTVLVHTLTKKSECREALSQISRFSAGALQSRPDVIGDQFVCLAHEKKTVDAQSLASRLSDGVRQRPDVVRAMQALGIRKPEAPRGASTGASNMTSGSADDRRLPQVAAKPPVQPPASQPPVTTNAAPPKRPAKSSAQALTTSRNLVRSSRFTEAVDELKPAVAADPGNRDLRLALLEAAMLAHDWRTALAQVTTTVPYNAGEEASMFYAAATLYESGRKDEARDLIQRARPRLNSTPMIDYYYNLIVGRR